MSRSNLHKKLKSLSGYVPNELIKLVKLKHAAGLLQAGDLTMTEVAYMTGFSSPSYFSKCFLQQFKVTPREYADRKTKPGTQDLDDLMKKDGRIKLSGCIPGRKAYVRIVKPQK